MNQLVLLAGGKATRLRPVTETIPKSMLEVAGKPFIAHQLELVRKNAIEKVLVCASFLGEQIKNYLGDGSRFGMSVEYSFDGDELLGTGGAIKKAMNMLDEQFYVMYGDSYLNTDFELINEYFFAQSKPALMTVYLNEGKWDNSNVLFEKGNLLKYDKVNRTSDMKHIDYGLGILPKQAFEEYNNKTVFDLSEVYGKLLEKDLLAGYEVKERFYEIGSFTGLEETDKFLRETNQNKPLE
ncbi:MAG: NTP transferase domain-containing protein [Ignavibacteria bacterium]|nr:NTP transferase domain-containing protein [Ignavibacteria bacterium]